MILCCPACQTQFKVDPALLGPDGRKVRCAKCSHVWRVGPDGAPLGQFGMKPSKSPAQKKPAPDTAPQEHAPTENPPGAASDMAAAPADDKKGNGESAPPGESGGEKAGPPAGETKTGTSATGPAIAEAVSQARARKGGRKFRVTLLLLCLAVIALFVAGVMTDRIKLGGTSRTPDIPSTGDVVPPPSDGNY